MPRRKQDRDVAKARGLRRKMTLPEVLLWRLLRAVEVPRIRRQHAIGKYVLDFYCAKTKLAIEVDGSVHGMGNKPETDRVRDDWLKSEGIEVVRIPAREVLTSPEVVADSIMRLCLSRMPHHHDT